MATVNIATDARQTVLTEINNIRPETKTDSIDQDQTPTEEQSVQDLQC